MTHNETITAVTGIVTTGILAAIAVGLYLPEILDALVAICRPSARR